VIDHGEGKKFPIIEGGGGVSNHGAKGAGRPIWRVGGCSSSNHEVRGEDVQSWS
jgi:hypothetical protein